MIVAASTALGLCVNYMGERPVPLLARDGPGAQPERAPRISLEALQTAMKAGRPILLLDVRREESFKLAHPLGGMNAPAEEFITHYERLNLATMLLAAETVVLVCESDQCPTGDRVSKLLSEVGHRNVKVLQGGWMAYRDSGLPVERASVPAKEAGAP
jgi:rhodanese-related sulfurtransferase